MKKLEDKILKKVYVFETRKTLVSAIIKLVSVSALIVGTLIMSTLLIQTLVERETFSVFEIFRQDFQALHSYLFDTFYVIAMEMPKVQFALSVTGCVMLMAVVILILKNFRRVRNKIFSLLHYWLRPKNSSTS